MVVWFRIRNPDLAILGWPFASHLISYKTGLALLALPVELSVVQKWRRTEMATSNPFLELGVMIYLQFPIVTVHQLHITSKDQPFSFA